MDASIIGGDKIGGDKVGGDKVGGDKITVGDIASSYAAIGAGAQVIVNQVQQALSAVAELESSIQAAERRLAEAVGRKLGRYTELTANQESEERENPYKALLDYKLEDAPFFYGREAAIAIMLEKMRSEGLTVLHSDSGSGKTSLLQAGLASRLLAEGAFPLYVRPYNLSPEQAIKKAFLPDYDTLPELARFRDEAMTLAGFLERVCHYLGARQLFVFLDQFEEFFTELRPENQASFAGQLRACIESDLPVSWVLALRKEYFSDLRVFRALKPFENEYFLPTFKLEEAHEVIVQPALLKGLTYAPGLVDIILDDLRQGADRVAPVQVQLVCHTLFEALRRGGLEKQITPRLYHQRRGRGEGLPGAQGILSSHLSRVLDYKLTGQERRTASQLLEALVTSDMRRVVKGQQRLLAAVAPEERGTVEYVLEVLFENRLIRRMNDDDNQPEYELTHDYLLSEIILDPQTRARKLAEEMLATDLWVYQQNLPDQEILIAEDRFNIINAQLELLTLEEASRELLEKSQQKIAAEREYELQLIHQRQVEAEARQAAEAEARQQAEARAREQEIAAAGLRRRLLYVALALIVAVGAVIVAVAFSLQSNINEVAAITAEAASETRAFEAQSAGATAEAETTRAFISEQRAIDSEGVAQQQTLLAVSRQLAAQSQAALDGHLDLALLLGLQGYLTSPTSESVDAMLESLRFSPLPYQLFYGQGNEEPQVMAVSADSTLAATGYADGTLVIVDLVTGQLVAVFQLDGSVWALLFLPDNRLLIGTSGGLIRLWDNHLEDPLKEAYADDPIVNLGFQETTGLAVAYDRYGKVTSWNLSDESVRLIDERPSATVERAVFSEDGKRLAYIDFDSVLVYDLDEGRLIFEQASTAEVVDVAISPDGTSVAAIQADLTVSVWDIDSGDSLSLASDEQTLLDINNTMLLVPRLAYSHNGHLLAMAAGSSVQLWDVETTRQVLPVLPGWPSVEVGVLAFTADDQALFGALTNGNLIRWDLQQSPEGTLLESAENSSRAILSPDGTLVAFSFAGLGQVRLWDTTGETAKRGQFGGGNDRVLDAAFLLDGTPLVLVDHPDGLRVWNLVSAEPFGPLVARFDEARLLVESDGRIVIMSYEDDRVRAVNGQTGAAISLPSIPVVYDRLTPLTADFPQIAMATSMSETTVINTVSGDILERIEEGLDPFAEAAYVETEEGGLLAGIVEDTLAVWDGATGSRIFTQSLTILREQYDISFRGPAVDTMVFSNNGQYLVTQFLPTNLFGSLFLVWNLESGQMETSVKIEEGIIAGVRIRPDDQMLIEYGSEGILQAWSFPEFEPLWDQTGLHQSDLRWPRFSENGQDLVTVDWEGNAGLWDTETGQRLPQEWNLHLSGIVDLRFAPDGSQLVSAAGDNSVAVWSTGTGGLVQTTSQLTFPVNVVNFDATGSRVAIAGSDGTVAIWDLATNDIKEIGVSDDGGSFKAMVFHPEEPWLALVAADNTILIYDLEADALLVAYPAGTEARELAWVEDGTLLMAVGSQSANVFAPLSGAVLTDTVRLNGELPQVQSLTGYSGTQTFLLFNEAAQAMWETANNQLYGPPLNLIEDMLLDAQLLPDGSILALAQHKATGQTRLVWLTYPDWQTAVCQTVNRSFTASESNIYEYFEIPDQEIACD